MAKLPKFFSRQKAAPTVQQVAEPKMSWHFNSILEAQRFVAVAARDMIERKIRRITLENAETTTTDLRAAIEAGDQLALQGALRKLMGVGVVMTTDEAKAKE